MATGGNAAGLQGLDQESEGNNGLQVSVADESSKENELHKDPKNDTVSPKNKPKKKKNNQKKTVDASVSSNTEAEASVSSNTEAEDKEPLKGTENNGEQIPSSIVKESMLKEEMAESLENIEKKLEEILLSDDDNSESDGKTGLKKSSSKVEKAASLQTGTNTDSQGNDLDETAEKMCASPGNDESEPKAECQDKTVAKDCEASNSVTNVTERINFLELSESQSEGNEKDTDSSSSDSESKYISGSQEESEKSENTKEKTSSGNAKAPKKSSKKTTTTTNNNKKTTGKGSTKTEKKGGTQVAAQKEGAKSISTKTNKNVDKKNDKKKLPAPVKKNTQVKPNLNKNRHYDYYGNISPYYNSWYPYQNYKPYNNYNDKKSALTKPKKPLSYQVNKPFLTRKRPIKGPAKFATATPKHFYPPANLNPFSNSFPQNISNMISAGNMSMGSKLGLLNFLTPQQIKFYNAERMFEEEEHYTPHKNAHSAYVKPNPFKNVHSAYVKPTTLKNVHSAYVKPNKYKNGHQDFVTGSFAKSAGQYESSKGYGMEPKEKYSQFHQQKYNSQLNKQKYNSQVGQQNYNSQVERQKYNSQVGQQNYNSQVERQKYNSQVGQQNYNFQFNKQKFNSQVGQQNYNSQVERQKYNSQAGQQKYNSQLERQKYNSQVERQKYYSQVGQQKYNSQIERQKYNSPVGQHKYNSQIEGQNYNSQAGRQRYNQSAPSMVDWYEQCLGEGSLYDSYEEYDPVPRRSHGMYDNYKEMCKGREYSEFDAYEDFAGGYSRNDEEYVIIPKKEYSDRFKQEYDHTPKREYNKGYMYDTVPNQEYTGRCENYNNTPQSTNPRSFHETNMQGRRFQRDPRDPNIPSLLSPHSKQDLREFLSAELPKATASAYPAFHPLHPNNYGAQNTFNNGQLYDRHFSARGKREYM